MAFDPISGFDFTERKHESTKGLIPKFYIKAVPHNYKSEQAGHPVYEDQEFIEIIMAGRRDTVDRKVKDEDKARWPGEYRAFKEGMEAPVSGTPIEEWAAITASQALELKGLGVRTVELLAELPDDALQRVMGGFGLRSKAAAWLEQAQGHAAATKWAAEREGLESQIAALRAQVEALAAQPSKKVEPHVEPA